MVGDKEPVLIYFPPKIEVVRVERVPGESLGSTIAFRQIGKLRKGAQPSVDTRLQTLAEY